MYESSTRFVTDSGGKYLAQLCKHFSHKIDVTWSENTGELRFSCGVAALNADENGLEIRVKSPDEEQLSQTQEVVESHLLRFAFRDKPTHLTWVV